MTYFNQEFLKFFSDLQKNNNREWFNENKKNYEKHVKEPFSQFIIELILRLRDEDQEFCADPKKAIFRIYRDIRFSKDKTPYKTYASAVLSYGGRKDLESPGFYVEISHDYFAFYAGAFMVSKDRLLSLRKFIITYKDEFLKLKNDKKFKEVFREIIGEENKVLPQEIKTEAEQIPELFKKQFYYKAEYPSAKILENDFTDFVMEHYFISRPLSDFIYEGMGIL